MSTSSTHDSLKGGSPIPPRGPETPTKLYSGGCHCGKFEFECRHPVVEDGFEVVTCNCSLCVQRGYLVMYIMDPSNDFKLTKGERQDLAQYNFNRGVVGHIFCPTCGCGLFAEVNGKNKIVAVNVRAVTGVDLDTLRLKKFDGRAI